MSRITAVRSLRGLVVAVVTGLAGLSPDAADADPATETALRALVAAIDASPDWVASATSVGSDPSGAGVLTGLRVQSSNPGMTIAIDKLTVTRGAAGADGRYSAAKATAATLTISAGPLGVTMVNVSLDDFASPAGVAFTFDPAKPASALVHAYGALAKTRIASASVGSLAMTETLANTTSRITYNNVNLARLDGGKIATLAAGPLLSETPVPDKANPKPLVVIRVASAASREIDLAALLRVYDLSPATGARNWTPAVANATYRDTSIAIPGITVKLGTVSMDDFKVRPADRNLALDLDRTITAPFEEGVSSDPAGLLNMLSAYSVGKFTAGPIDVAAAGIENVHLDGIAIANLSLDGLGEFALNGFAAGVKDVASLKAGRIAVGNLVFPKSSVLAAGLRTALAGGDVDVSTLAPTVGFVEFGALDLNVTGYPSTRLGKARVDLANHVSNIPTSFKVEVAGAELEASLMPSLIRDQLAHFGYQRVKTDLSGRIDWSEARGMTTLSGLTLSVPTVGAVTVDAVLNGPSRTDIDALATVAGLQSFSPKLSLVSGALSFKDDSIVGKVISDQATTLKVEPDRFRDQFARGLPFLLLPVGTPDFQRKASPVLQEFVRTPGTITFTAAPAMPVPIQTLISSATGSGVFTLPTVLNLAVSSVPGPRPPTSPAPAPAPGPAIMPSAPPAAGDIRGTVAAPN